MGRQPGKAKRPPILTPVQPAPVGTLTLADLWIVVGLAVACLVAFGGTTDGQFVYDDTLQIQSNMLIQTPGLAGKALASDVWAFKGARDDPWSNYWRPGFILWLIGNVRAFGVQDPRGWHVTTILLHVLATGLGYALLRQMKLERLVAAAAALIFAVHPVHVESVAWISGCTDPLMAVGMFGSLWCLLSWLAQPKPWKMAAATALYAFTMTTKESAVVYPAVALVAAWSFDPKREGGSAGRVRRALLAMAPFAAVAVVFFLARYAVLAKVELRPPWHGGLPRVVRSAPGLALFYVRQIVFPLHIGPMYPIRAVEAGQVGFSNFVLPLLGCLAVAGAALAAAWRNPARRVGLAIFAFVLLPAMNVNAFVPEQVVHDRYLYIPLLGALCIFATLAAEGLAKVASVGKQRAPMAVLVASAVLALPLLAVTWSYNAAWKTDRALWSWAVKSDPTSASSLAQLALYVEQGPGNYTEALGLLDQAIAMRPNLTQAYKQRGTIALREKRHADAERDYHKVLDSFPGDPLVISNLATCYEQQGKLAEAEQVLRKGRQDAPHIYCALTDSLAVVLYRGGKRDEALRELEAARPRVAAEYGPAATRVLFRLGVLYQELGRGAESAAAFSEFLRTTENVTEPSVRELRKRVPAAQSPAPAG